MGNEEPQNGSEQGGSRATVSLVIISFNRKNDLEICLRKAASLSGCDQIIVVDNCSTDGTDQLLTNLSREYPILEIYRSETNRGVAGGRNFGISKAKGDILVFLDDDAWFETEDPIRHVRAYFQNDPALGVLAFKIKNYYTGTVRWDEFPTLDRRRNPDIEFLTSYFVGAGHAIRRRVLESTGNYPEDFFYGKEELDLSFRIIDHGYTIKYCPVVGVIHKQSVEGRVAPAQKWLMVYRNRLIVAYRYLPFIYRVISGVLWFLKITSLSRSLSVPIKSVVAYRSSRKNIERRQVSSRSLAYLKQHDGRLYY